MKAWVMMLVMLAGPAMAGTPAPATSGVLAELCGLVSQYVQWLIMATFLIASIGLAFASMKASATGRFPMGGFVSLAGGMFVLGAVPAVVSFVTQGTFSWTC